MPSRLILASQSPRRRELLAEAGYTFEVMPPREEAEEADVGIADPAELVQHLARCKAADVAVRVPEGIIIGCDTVAAVDGQILGKPRDRTHAREMFTRLRGQQHQVVSGLCLWQRPVDRVQVASDVTILYMEPLTDEQIEEYLDSGAWQGKAGAFGYQDRHGWLRILSGSESNVVGLPLELFREMIKEFTS